MTVTALNSTVQTAIRSTPGPGDTSSAGRSASSAVVNRSTVNVKVAGANQSSISEISSSTVEINNSTVTGAAAGLPALQSSSVPTPGSDVPSPPVAVPATALAAQNTLSSTTTVVTQAIAIQSTNRAGNVSSSVASEAVSAVSRSAADSGVQATSGPSSAIGLAVQNTVTSNARVSVQVGGQNFAPIQVIVDSVARILNLGVAPPTTGDTTEGPAATPATGSRIQNTVSLRSTAAVHVVGDNHNPIDIVLNLVANLVNTGVGLAQSGDGQASAAGGSATGGTATASGLQATNLVNMFASAAVDIDGNNYAPIFVHIFFASIIDNQGSAGSSGGNLAAGGARNVAPSRPSIVAAPASGGQSPASQPALVRSSTPAHTTPSVTSASQRAMVRPTGVARVQPHPTVGAPKQVDSPDRAIPSTVTVASVSTNRATVAPYAPKSIPAAHDDSARPDAPTSSALPQDDPARPDIPIILTGGSHASRIVAMVGHTPAAAEPMSADRVLGGDDRGDTLRRAAQGDTIVGREASPAVLEPGPNDVSAADAGAQLLPMPVHAQPELHAAAASPAVDLESPDDPDATPVEFGLAAMLSTLGGLSRLRRVKSCLALARSKRG